MIAKAKEIGMGADLWSNIVSSAETGLTKLTSNLISTGVTAVTGTVQGALGVTSAVPATSSASVNAPSVVSAAEEPSNMKYYLIGGGVLAALIVLMMVMKRK